MAGKIKTCKVTDIIEATESGDLDLERVQQIVEKIGAVATENPGHNILLDLRNTELSAATMGDMLETAATADQFKALHEVKIAGIVPDESIRSFVAERMQGVMQLKGFDYRVFTDADEASEWLAE